jgi:WD40 repeat protein
VKVRFLSAVFDRDDEIVAATYRRDLTVYSPRQGSRAVAPHLGNATHLEVASSGKSLAAYGPLDSVEIWDAPSHRLRRVIATGHGVVSRVAFTGAGDELVTSGRDGRLLSWPATGEVRQLVKLDQPIASFVLTSRGGAAVIATSEGALWRTDAAGHAVVIRAAGPLIVQSLSEVRAHLANLA